jgi:superfamily II DNA or RNA helicase
MTPRQWQIEAMDAIYQGMADYSKILVSAATGTGKGSLIAALAVCEFRNGKRLLFLVHRDELIDDVMARAKATYPGIDAGKVKGPLNQIDRQIVFASVQSLRGRRLAELDHFDFVITDEAHHATAPSYLQIYYQIEKINPNWKHIGFTATPFRYGGVGKTAGLGKAFQRLVYEYPLAQAIEDGALCPLRGVAVETHLDLAGVDPDSVDRLAAIVDTPSRNQIVAAKYLELAAGKSAICFSVTVAHAAHLAQAMVDAGVAAEAVWGTDPDRTAKIARYKAGTTQVLCNCELLTEGFDAPQTEAVILVRPTGSIGLYSQMVGRGTRLFPGKAEGLVIDFVGNAAKYPLVRLSDLTTPVAPVETDLRRDDVEVQERLTPPDAVGSEHAPVDLFARPKATFYGYTRIKKPQEAEPYTDMLRASGCSVYRVDMPGKPKELPALLAFMRRGDVLVVVSIGDLSDSVGGINEVLQEMVLKGLEMRLANRPNESEQVAPVATQPQHRKPMPPQHVKAQRAGIEKAKAKGVYQGKKAVIPRNAVIEMVRTSGMSKTDIAFKMGIGRASLYRILKEEHSGEPPLL